MSEQDNVQVVQKAHQLILSRDLAAVMPLCTEDFVLVSPGPKELLPWAGEYHGPQGFVQYWTAFGKALEMSDLEVEGILAQGDKVVVQGNHTGRVRATGKSYHLDWVQVWALREGKIASMRNYNDSYPVAQAVRPD